MYVSNVATRMTIRKRFEQLLDCAAFMNRAPSYPCWLRTLTPLAAGSSLVALLVFASACGGSEPAQPPESYSVRGLIRQLPKADRPGSELQVWHEAIPEFKDAEGQIVGMESMTMGFPLADSVLAADLSVGDRIRLDFEVRWDSGHPLTITALEKLPSETRLAFEQTNAVGESEERPSEEPGGSQPNGDDDATDENAEETS